MKVIFLDIDGVLNSTEWARTGVKFGRPPLIRERVSREILAWCPSMVRRLRWIVEDTGAHIVISSSWRGYGAMAVRKWRAMFRLYGWKDAPVIGETPQLDCRVGTLYVAKTRGDEVAAWLEQNQHVKKFVCIDDCQDFRPNQPLVRTDMQFGLQDEEAKQCISVLGSSDS
jgi:hypothetical protein